MSVPPRAGEAHHMIHEIYMTLIVMMMPVGHTGPGCPTKLLYPAA